MFWKCINHVKLYIHTQCLIVYIHTLKLHRPWNFVTRKKTSRSWLLRWIAPTLKRVVCSAWHGRMSIQGLCDFMEVHVCIQWLGSWNIACVWAQTSDMAYVYIYIYIYLFMYLYIYIYICCIRINIFYIWYGQRYCSDKLPPKKDLSQHRWSSQYGKRPHDMRAGKGVCEMGVQVCQRGQGKERVCQRGQGAQSPNRQGTNGHRHTPSHCMWTSIWQHVYRVCN